MNFFSPPTYSLLCLILSALSIGQGIFVLAKSPRATINQSYFLFCFAIFMWLFPMALLSSKSFSIHSSEMLAKIVFIGVSILPCSALHFTSEFLGKNKPPNTRNVVISAYTVSVVLILLLFFTDKYITGVYNYQWGYFPRGGLIHGTAVMLIMSSAIYAVALLFIGLRKILISEGKSRKYYECKSVIISFIFVTMAGSDFLHNWGIDFFPVGCIFVTLFLTFINYAIFKHKLLGITVVLKSGLIYSILVSLVTALYFLAVYVSGMLVGDLTKVHSPSIILVILALITLLFRPLEKKVRDSIDRIFVIKSREVIEKENLLLLSELQKQDRMKAVSTLAAGMAHEIKNPLTAIKTFTESLSKKSSDQEFIAKFQKIVGSEVDKIDGIVKQLLEFSKPTPAIFMNCDIINILQETIQLLDADFLKRKVAVTTEFHQPSAMIRGDKVKLKQAFLNIFLNGIQAMPNGGVLAIISRISRDSSLILSIRDSGSGISKEDLPHIFDPFFTTKIEGSGLGLAVVHGIISEHAGIIKASSVLGSGTMFEISFGAK